MFKERTGLYKKIEEACNSKLLVYVTGTRRGAETQIANDVLPKFAEHLDRFGDAKKITLFLYTNGGDTLAAWSLVNLIKSYCDEFEVIIPANCFSSGTLICLAADELIMTKQAMLGPIDPSVNGPLNPQIPGPVPNMKVPVSVEHVNAYIEMAKTDFGISNEELMTKILLNLSEKIHPLTLGQVYKSKSQIQMLARKLLAPKQLEKEKEDKIINFLCSESGSHDYSIRRKEASEDLGLRVIKPSVEFYEVIKRVYDDIAVELSFDMPFVPAIEVGMANPPVNKPYSIRRGLIESLSYGTDVFISEGHFVKQVIQPNPVSAAQIVVNDNRTFEGWRHEDIQR